MKINLYEAALYAIAIYIVIGAWIGVTCMFVGYTLATHRRLAWWRDRRLHLTTASILFGSMISALIVSICWPLFFILVREFPPFAWPTVDMVEKLARKAERR